MSAAEDRLANENNYLLSRVIELEEKLHGVLDRLNATVEVLNAGGSLKLLKASEVAEHFQVSEQRIHELKRTHGLPVIQWGNHQDRFDPVAIRRWLNNGGRIGEDDQQGLKLLTK